MATTYPEVYSQAVEVVIAGKATGGAGDQQPIANILHYAWAGTGDPGTPNLNTFLTQLAATISVQWHGAGVTGYVVDTVSARSMRDPTTGPALWGTPNQYSGALTGDWQPPDSSVFVEKVSAWRYKGSRPGVHFSPVAEDLTTDFVLNSTGLTAFGNLATALNATITEDAGFPGYYPVIISTKYSYIDVSTGLMVIKGAPVTVHRVRKTLGHMTGRTVKGRY